MALDSLAVAAEVGVNDMDGPQGDISTELPESGAATATSGSVLPPGHPLASLDLAHQQAKATTAKINQASTTLDSVRNELDKLVAMGDSITSDDVLEGMSKLVAGGVDPKQLLSMIAGNPDSGVPPMPESGEALAGWIGQQDQLIKTNEAQASKAQAIAQHQQGVAAMRLLAGHAIMGRAPAPATAASPPNPLTQ